jgi:hypothetical protein
MRVLARILPLIVIALALTRMASVVVQMPMIGYANQYDMARTSACIGLWPKQERRDEANPQAPVRIYVQGPTQAELCYPGTDVAIAVAAKAAWTLAASLDLAHPSEFDLRWVGLLRLVLFVIAAFLVAFALIHQPWVAALHALSLLMVFSDPIGTLFFNTLYSEFSAVFGSYLVFGALLMATADRSNASFAMRQGLLMVGLLALLFSRAQHLWLPLLLVLPMAAFDWRAHISRGFVPLMVSAVVLALACGIRFTSNTAPAPELAKANAVNAVFAAHLPAYPDAGRALLRMGLGPDCRKLVHTSWYRRRGYDVDSVCPEVFDVSRASLLSSLMREPAALIRLAALSMVASSGWRMGSVGEVEGQIDARIDADDVFLGGSVSRLVDRLSFRAYVFFWALPLVAGLFAGTMLAIGRSGAPMNARDGDFVRTNLGVLSMAALITAYAWASSVFGDGTSELARHLHLGQLFSMVAWLAIALLSTYSFARWLFPRFTEGTGREGPTRATAWLFALSVPVAGAMTFLLTQAPASIGSIDVLDRHDYSRNERLKLSGWVKDPDGAEDIAFLFRGKRYPVESVRPASDVDRWFPVGPRHPATAFSATVDPGPATETGAPLELVVTNRKGATHVVDAIWLTIE